LYASPNIIRVSKSREIRRARHVARMGEARNAQRTLVGRLKGRDHFEDLDIDGRITLE